jgi:hypothetical protein
LDARTHTRIFDLDQMSFGFAPLPARLGYPGAAMSFMTRSRRRLTAGFALAALTFAYAAMASYGCLTGRTPEPQMMCEEHPSPAPSVLLCRVHLQSETQTLDLAKIPQVSPLDAPVPALAAERAVAPVASAGPHPARIATANAPPLPLNLLYSRFLT